MCLKYFPSSILPMKCSNDMSVFNHYAHFHISEFQLEYCFSWGKKKQQENILNDTETNWFLSELWC